jgi:hypothetical protein
MVPHPAVPHQVDSATRTCCGGIGRHNPQCQNLGQPPATENALMLDTRLDTAVNLIDLARNDLNVVLRAMSDDAPLFAVVDLVTALGHLRQAALLADKVAATGVAIEVR